MWCGSHEGHHEVAEAMEDVVHATRWISEEKAKEMVGKVKEGK